MKIIIVSMLLLSAAMQQNPALKPQEIRLPKRIVTDLPFSPRKKIKGWQRK